MSSRHHREEKKSSKSQPVTSHCVALVFKHSDKSGTAGRLCGGNPNNPHSVSLQRNTHVELHPQYDGDRPDDDPGSLGDQQDSPRGGDPEDVNFSEDVHFNPKEVLDEFKLRNKTCYWNPALVDSVKSLEYVGFLDPYTILVKGDEIHLENIRTAWGRRVLKDPAHFCIEKIGDVSGIEMQVVPQTQFIPLPEALCLIIMDLNNNQITATLDTVCERLHQCYQGLQLPSNQLLYDTLGNLIRERKLFHTGMGYFVVTPDTFRLHGDDPTSSHFGTAWTHLHPMYIPASFSQPPRAPMRSISCQVDVQEDNEGIPQTSTKRRTSGIDSGLQTTPQEIPHVQTQTEWGHPRVLRSQSMCRSREKKKRDDSSEYTLRRSLSVHGRKEKENTLPKDKNIKESQPKSKGEKISIFAKLFGRGKKKTTTPAPAKPKVEYASFSAQFPPPEWLWYQQQVDRQLRTETWVQQQIIKSGMWHNFASSLPQDGNTEVMVASTVDCVSAPGTYHPYKSATQRVSKSKSRKLKDHAPVVIANRSGDVMKMEKNQRNSCHGDVYHKHKDSHGASETVAITSTSELVHSRYMNPPLYSSTPRVHEPHVIDVGGQRHDMTVDQFTVSHQSVTNVKHSNSHKKSERKTKKKAHKDRHSSFHPSHKPEDISYQYQGVIPQKNNPVGISRDSGVNCIGTDAQKSHTGSKSHSSHSRSKSHRNMCHLDEGVEQTVELPSHPEREGHIYANVHVQNPSHRPHLPERPHRKSPRENNAKTKSRHSSAIESDMMFSHADRLKVELPSTGRKFDQGSDRGTVHSRSSQDTGAQDSTLGGSSDRSFGTVINMHTSAINRPIENLISETKDLALADSGFSSPRTSENSTDNKKNQSNVSYKASKPATMMVCNEGGKESSLNNSLSKQDSLSEDSSGRISASALYENVKIDNTEVFNNLKYLHKEINVSSQNLNTPLGSQGSQGSHDHVSSGVLDLDPKQPVVKKFNFDGDFHVVGVV